MSQGRTKVGGPALPGRAPEDGPFVALSRPIRFALKNDGKNLGIVKGLEASLKKTIGALKDAPNIPARIHDLERLVQGLEQLDLPGKKTRLEKMLAVLEGAPLPPPKAAKPATPKKIERAAPKIEPKAVKKKRVTMAEAEPDDQLLSLVGVGPKTAERFAERGLLTVTDALFFLPRRFEDRSRLSTVQELEPGKAATIVGEVRATSVRPMGRGRRVFEMAVTDGTGTVSVRFFRFHQTNLEGRFPRGTKVVVSGPVTAYGAMRQMIHPDLEKLEEGEAATPGGIIPIYGEIEGVAAKVVRRILSELASVAPKIVDPLPAELLARHGLSSLGEALLGAHRPETMAAASIAAVERRLVFDELLYLQLALLFRQRAHEGEPGLVTTLAPDWQQQRGAFLPFELTKAQARAIAEIEADLALPRPMHRLLLGDVGSGKTAVAFLAAMAVRAAGRQSALLVPTEILAEQHHQNALKMLTGVKTALLTGSTKPKARKELLGRLASGDLELLIGTHAILEPPVVFKDLGLAIVDEQHRFGVEQRAALFEKRSGARPDVLVMTATPIPRTLALTAYGDLRMTTIDELPPGRPPIVTKVLPRARIEEAYRAIDAELEKGRQAYVVFPLVEASEKLDLRAAIDAVAELEARFAGKKVGLLHGRMTGEQKQAVMAEFVAGRVPILVSTTVIEVGVDVKNATLMLVEDAERFGLSQLHQLRGRVGRGEHPGLCLLIGSSQGAEAKARLGILAETRDGFVIAEKDLELRGPGEILGTKQSGLPDLVLADLIRDAKVLDAARLEAERIMESDPELLAHPHLKEELTRRFSARFDLLRSG